jgi:hypothetical protein
MEGLIYSLAGRLDGIRGRVLRSTLSVTWLRAIYCDRARRLACLFALSLTLSLCASLFFPLAVLIIGPILYGFPHLVASFRYVGEEVSPGKLWAPIHLFSVLFAAVASVRILIDLRILALPHFLVANFPELLSLVVTWAGCLLLFCLNRRHRWLGPLLFSPLLFFSWWLPMGTLGILILLHNYAGFFYWIRSARPGREKKVAWFATLAFCGTNVLLFLGAFDALYGLAGFQSEVAFAQMDFIQIGQMIFPWSADGALWLHGTVAYAFGQSVHYFVWLKAIPDEQRESEIPTSFRRTARTASRDFGSLYFKLAVVFVVAGACLWLIVPIALARTLYFAISGYHTYLELIGLSFGALSRATC